MATKSSKKYKGVYCDNKGKIFYQIDLGIDPVTGKRVQKKARKNQYGKTFETMKEAYDELVRIKYEFANKVSLENYNMTFENYMNKIYLRAYKQKVQSVTYKTALPHHKLFIQYFGLKPLKAITPRDCEAFRLHIIENYSENYAKNLWSRFKACMGYAERLGYISNMPCKALDNPRGKHPETPFWTYAEFQTFIKSFDLHDYEELQRFTAIWLYYMTGVRVSEGLSLCWEDIDFDKKFLKVHTTLEKNENGNLKGSENFILESCTLSEGGHDFVRLYFNSPLEVKEISSYIFEEYINTKRSATEYLNYNKNYVDEYKASPLMENVLSNTDVKNILVKINFCDIIKDY